jgi:hypothetical protein
MGSNIPESLAATRAKALETGQILPILRKYGGCGGQFGTETELRNAGDTSVEVQRWPRIETELV